MPVVTQFPTANEVLGADNWTNPNNAHADDETDATCSSSAAPNKTFGNKWKTFGFDSVIPVGSNVLTVKAILEHAEVATGTATMVPSLEAYVSGVGQGVHQGPPTESDPEAVETVDLTPDRTWTRDDLLDSVFAVAVREDFSIITTGSGSANMDYVKVEVTYVTTNTPYRPFNSGPM